MASDFQETKIKTSILVTLTLLFVCIGVIPLMISNWRVISINQEKLDTTLRENFLNTAANVSTRISDYVNYYRSQTREYRDEALAQLRASEQTQNQPPELMRELNIVKVRILNPAGQGPYFQKVNFVDSRVPNLEFEAFNHALKGESYIGTPYFDAQDDLPLVVLAEPLSDSMDRVLGVLSVIVRLDPLVETISEPMSGGTEVYIVDSNGKLVLHPKKEEMEAAPDLSKTGIVSDFLQTKEPISSSVRPFKEKKGDETIDILGSYSRVRDLNWGVILQIEKDIALASVNQMIKTSLVWGIIFALAACAVGIALARWITRPIQTLAQHVQEVGKNQDFDRKVHMNAGNEIQQLADTFNYMTDEIKQNVLGLQRAARENKELFMSSIRMLAAAIDAKDPYTRGHSERVKDYTLVIGRAMNFNAEQMERLEIAALLHDVGKIGIDDRILRKPTNLTPEEFEVMKTHPDKGASIISQVAQLTDVIPGLRGHHENFDGSGYPQGIKGEEIHIFARVITVADTFDAMTTDRPYQKAFTLEFALNRIRSMVNVKYDPKVVEAFARACEEGKVTLHKPSRPRPKPTVV